MERRRVLPVMGRSSVPLAVASVWASLPRALRLFSVAVLLAEGSLLVFLIKLGTDRNWGIVRDVREFTMHGPSRFAHMMTVDLCVMATTVLLLCRFVLDFVRPRYRIKLFPVIQIMEVVNYSMVHYTLGMMQTSAGTSAGRVNDYFQVWAVLLVTLQYSVKIGRPYSNSKQIPLLDLMSSLWSANLLRLQTVQHLKYPLRFIWVLNAARIIWYFSVLDKAAVISQENTRLVSDYMSYEHTRPADPGRGTNTLMSGYRYLVTGEDLVVREMMMKQQKRVASSAAAQYQYRKLDPNNVELITVHKVWNAADSGGSGSLLGGDDRLKDVCLSFALYKLLRRQFYHLPVHEARQPKTRRLVMDCILQDAGNYERAFRVTAMELFFLQDLLRSKRAAMFTNGFPWLSLVLSVLLVAATGYIGVPVGHLPERLGPADRNRITHGVFITRSIVALIIIKEILEIYMYMFSQWTKVLVLCSYVRHRYLRHPLVERVMRLMFCLIPRCKWSQNISQRNLLLPPPNLVALVTSILFNFELCGTSIKLDAGAKTAIFEAFKRLKNNPERLNTYFSNAFASNQALKQQLAWAVQLEGATHVILVWHIATSLCEINLSPNPEKLKARLLKTRQFVKKAGDVADDAWGHYVTAASLSNYCVHLVTQALVPDNGLVTNKVYCEVCRELNHVRVSITSMQGMYNHLMAIVETPSQKESYQVPDQAAEPDEEAPEGDDASQESEQAPDHGEAKGLDISNSLTKMGAKLGKQLIEACGDDKARLWKHLSEFWTGFLLHLAASTDAAKHETHLENGEMITHLWTLLYHAGFVGSTSHGQQLFHPGDLHSQVRENMNIAQADVH